MTDSDVIEIISIICSSVLSIVAIVISVLTLIQNSKMIFESNKPNITIFSKILNFTSPYPFLVLKNFGVSGATILNIEYDGDLRNYLEREPFKNMKDVFIAPNQTFVYSLNHENFDYDKVFNFKITYKYINKIYTEKCQVSFKQYLDIAYTKNHFEKCSPDTKELSDVLQEMIVQDI
jgi:hypothetical protein